MTMKGCDTLTLLGETHEQWQNNALKQNLFG